MSRLSPARHVEHGSHGSGTSHSMQDAILALDEDGFIREGSPEVESLFGYRTSEVLGRHVSFLLPELARIPLLRSGAVNPRLAFLCHCGKRFAAARREGWAFFAELFVHKVEGRGHGTLRLMVREAGKIQRDQVTPGMDERPGDFARVIDI